MKTEFDMLLLRDHNGRTRQFRGLGWHGWDGKGSKRTRRIRLFFSIRETYLFLQRRFFNPFITATVIR